MRLIIYILIAIALVGCRATRDTHQTQSRDIYTATNDSVVTTTNDTYIERNLDAYITRHADSIIIREVLHDTIEKERIISIYSPKVELASLSNESQAQHLIINATTHRDEARDTTTSEREESEPTKCSIWELIAFGGALCVLLCITKYFKS